jgi:ubiquinone/menaquinone biosynthesis C-methylase UbiE
MVADLNLPLALEDNSYDAVVSSGTFTHGHVGPEPLGEIFRILRPGGLLACTVHFDLWHNKGFDSVFASLMSQKKIKSIALREGPYFDNQDAEGWFCVYQKYE